MTNGKNTGLSTIADRYAIAMIDLGEKTDQLDAFHTDFNTINATVSSNPELSTFLTHPIIPLNEKKELIEKIFVGSISQYALNLVRLLLDRNRVFLLPAVASHYSELLNKKRNISIANVITAIEIDEETQNRIKNKLQSILNQNITIKSEIDPEIIAGMVVKVGDKTIDGSIRTKLENMKRQLI